MQTIYLDISNKGVIPTIYAKQGDIGRKIQVIFTDSGIPYKIPENAKFSVWYDGDSGDGNYTDIGDKSAIVVENNKVTFEMITQMLNNDGEGIVCLIMNVGEEQIGSWNIRYLCERVPGFDSEGASSYFTAFSESVNKLKDTDKTLTKEGYPADAKATGDKIDNLTAGDIGAAPADSVGTNKVFNKLTDIGITTFPTTMQTVANSMPANSTLMLDSRDIIAGGNHEISDLGLNNSGMYMFMRGNSNARLSLLHIYGATSSTTSYINYGCYAASTNKVVWVLGERQNSTYPDCRFRIAEDKNNEWINPPMVVGTEYRTTERHNGKPVYAKAVEFGALPNASSAVVPHEASDVENILSCVGTLSNGSSLPYAGETYNMFCQSNKTKISIVTTSDASSFTAVVTIKYTKTTD